MALAALGRLVHVSGDLLSKIEKADRWPQPDRLTRLNVVLEADGRTQAKCRPARRHHRSADTADEESLSPDTALPICTG
ncbi:hypothetical protein [Pseudonocardia sp. N23]|uniref:hypothetical protein n=1 Tax=Pseudonocardia sp. N23 TaxID=1987376 RepID=UPI0035B5C6BF